MKKVRVRKCSTEWDTDSVLNLIQNVERYENLWNPSHRTYKDREVNTNSWESVANAMGIPKNEVCVKWNAIRCNYRTHLKSINENKSGQAKKNKKANPIYAAMAFINPVLSFQTLNGESNLTESISVKIDDAVQEQNEIASDSDILLPETSSSPETSSPVRKRQRQDSYANDLRTSAMVHNDDWMMESKADQWESFGNYIASNARTWALEHNALAHRYKAAIGAVTAQFELEVANLLTDRERHFQE